MRCKALVVSLLRWIWSPKSYIGKCRRMFTFRKSWILRNFKCDRNLLPGAGAGNERDGVKGTKGSGWLGRQQMRAAPAWGA